MGSPEPFPSGQGASPDAKPAGFPAVTPTGDAAVDDVLQTLISMPELSEPDQHTAYERLHDELLAELNTEQN